MAHIHILVQPTSFWWPRYLEDPKSGTALSKNPDCMKGAADDHEQLHKQQSVNVVN